MNVFGNCLLLICMVSSFSSCQQDVPYGVYASFCRNDDGKPYSDWAFVDVGEDGIRVSGFNDFYALGEEPEIIYPDSLYHQPIRYRNFFGHYDTLSAEFTDNFITLTNRGDFPCSYVAGRVKNGDNAQVRPASLAPFANKIFERWSDRSVWIFSADNRMQVRDYRGEALRPFEYVQLYSVEEFAGEAYLNVHPAYREKYRIAAVSPATIVLEQLGCTPHYDTLRYLRDTQIVRILPPETVLREEAHHEPQTYSTYWYETRWTITLTADGYFKYHPSGHFSNYHLWTGTYTEQDSIITLNFAESDFADFSSIDPSRLFRLQNGYLLMPNGSALGPPDDNEHLYSERFFLLQRAVDWLKEREPFLSRLPSEAYLRAAIISVDPDTLVRFSPAPRRNFSFPESLADTLTLTEVRHLDEAKRVAE